MVMWFLSFSRKGKKVSPLIQSKHVHTTGQSCVSLLLKPLNELHIIDGECLLSPCVSKQPSALAWQGSRDEKESS